MQKAVERPPAVSLIPKIRNVPALRPLHWLVLASTDIRRAPFASLFYGVVFALMGQCLHWLFLSAPHQTVTLTTGFMLLGPFLCMGLYDIGRRLELGQSKVFIPSLLAWKRNLPGTSLFAIILALTFAGWMRVSVVLFALFYTEQIPTIEDMFKATFFTEENLAFVIAYFSCGAMFALLVFAISVVSIPMLLAKDGDTLTAIFTSVQALLRNPLSMLVWGSCIVLLFVLGVALFYAGLTITMPLAGLATWHAYREIVEKPLEP